METAADVLEGGERRRRVGGAPARQVIPGDGGKSRRRFRTWLCRRRAASLGTAGEHKAGQQGRAETAHGGYSPGSFATSRQFGFELDMSRSNVQRSTMVSTWLGAPAIG